MTYSVNTNAGAMIAVQNLNRTNMELEQVQSRINTGLAVSGAKDNGGIYAIAQRMRSEVSGYKAVQDSLNRAVSTVDVALAGGEAISDLLIEMKEKALASADSVLMYEHSVYSVISPEGCASILWRSADEAQTAAEALKLTAQDLIELNVVDKVIAEPVGGAHRDPAEAMQTLGKAIEVELMKFIDMDGGAIRAKRREKFLNIGRKGV